MLRPTFALLALAFAAPPVVAEPAHHAHGHGAAASLSEPGEAAFGAIREIVETLEADPSTDWSRVDIEDLRRHLRDMSLVTLRAEATSEPLVDGVRFIVEGDGETAAAIRRMTLAHSETMNGRSEWRFAAAPTARGATLTVRPRDPADLPKLRALGFIGVMTLDGHHQAHHLAIARGDAHRH